jgi:uncharacterized protein (DUF3084 family)
LTTHLDAANKALTEDRNARQAVDQELQAAQESNTALNQELWAAQDSTAAANQDMSFKVAALNELSMREQATHDALWALAEEKQILEQELKSTRKMFAEWDFSSSKVISSAVAHAVALLKSYTSDLDLELFCKEYQCKDDAERDALTY